MKVVDALYAITTGPRRRRQLLTPVGLFFAFALMGLVVVGGLYTDRVLGLKPLLAGALGATIGAGLACMGLALWAWCLALFKGKGVPFNPPEQLVATGPYAWVRNPMLSGLCVALFGVGFIVHSTSVVFLWAPAFVLLNVVELKMVEEPELQRRLGAAYKAYKDRVPMLIPRRPRAQRS